MQKTLTRAFRLLSFKEEQNYLTDRKDWEEVTAWIQK